jgi:hypothetical protein
MKHFAIAYSLLKRFDLIGIEHVPRFSNQQANDLAQIASSCKVSKEKLRDLIEIKDKLVSNQSPLTELSMPKLVGADEPQKQNNFEKNVETFVIDNLFDNDWRKPIVDYLEDPKGPTDRKIKYKALSYIIVENELFKKTVESVLLKCVNETEAYVAISNVHGGSCGAHQASHKMK